MNTFFSLAQEFSGLNPNSVSDQERRRRLILSYTNTPIMQRIYNRGVREQVEAFSGEENNPDSRKRLRRGFGSRELAKALTGK